MRMGCGWDADGIKDEVTNGIRALVICRSVGCAVMAEQGRSFGEWVRLERRHSRGLAGAA